MPKDMMLDTSRINIICLGTAVRLNYMNQGSTFFHLVPFCYLKKCVVHGVVRNINNRFRSVEYLRLYQNYSHIFEKYP